MKKIKLWVIKKSAWESLLARVVRVDHFKLLITEDIWGFELWEQGGQSYEMEHTTSPQLSLQANKETNK